MFNFHNFIIITTFSKLFQFKLFSKSSIKSYHKINTKNTKKYQKKWRKIHQNKLQQLIVHSVCFTPLIFCLLGTVIVLRFNRGGRGFGTVLALAVLIGFYLLAFLGEQLARTGKISVFQGSLLPMFGSLAAISGMKQKSLMAMPKALWIHLHRLRDLSAI